jgi:hypothetical protein
MLSPYSFRNPLDEFPPWAENVGRLLIGGRFYFVDTKLGPHINGLAGVNIDVVFASEIGDRWQGRGPTIVVDLDQIWNQCSDGWDPATYGSHRFIDGAVGLFVHELAHTIARDELCGNGSAEQVTPYIQQFLATPYSESREAAVPWRDHDGGWLRMVLHILHRIEEIVGFSFRHLDDNIVFPGYRLRPLSEYRLALGDEPRRLANATFTEIRSSSPPQAFVNKWHQNINEWFAKLSEPTPIQVRALSLGRSLFPSLKGDFFMDVITQVSALREQRRQSALARLDGMAKSQMAGNPPTPEELLAALDEAGTSEVDYEKRLKHIQRRLPWLKGQTEKSEVLRRQAEAKSRMDSARAKLEIAQQEFVIANTPAEAEFRQAESRLGEIEADRRKLRDECQDPEITTALRKKREIWGPARNRVLWLSQRERELTEKIRDADRVLEPYEALLVSVGATGGGNAIHLGELTRSAIQYPEAEKLAAIREEQRAELTAVKAELELLGPKVPVLESEIEDLLQQAERSEL